MSKISIVIPCFNNEKEILKCLHALELQKEKNFDIIIVNDCSEDNSKLVIEEYIKGREFACGIIDGRALPPIEIIPKSGFFDYANTYQADATEEICPANISDDITKRMQELTLRAYHVLKLNVYSRADFLLDEKGNLYCLEMNTLPGMTEASLLPKEAQAIGISYGDLCELIIQKSLEARYQ